MFAWLSRLFRRSSDAWDIYTPRERSIYRYFAGEYKWYGLRKVYLAADPMLLYRRISDVGPELKTDMEVMEGPWAKVAGPAFDRAVDTIRDIFSVPKLEKGGLTQAECIFLFDHFMTYCGMLKKNSPQSPASSNSSPDSPTTSSDASESATPSSSPSTSTAVESKTDAPGPSQGESASPLGSSIPDPSSTSP